MNSIFIYFFVNYHFNLTLEQIVPCAKVLQAEIKSDTIQTDFIFNLVIS